MNFIEVIAQQYNYCEAGGRIFSFGQKRSQLDSLRFSSQLRSSCTAAPFLFTIFINLTVFSIGDKQYTSCLLL